MELTTFNNLVPGNRLRIGNVEKVALFKRWHDRLICNDGGQWYYKDLGYKVASDTGDSVYLVPQAVRLLGDNCQKVLSVQDLKVGDHLLLVFGMRARVLTVAVKDSDRKVAYSRSGEVIPFGPSIYRSGFRTEETDLLTDEGRQELSKIYV